MTNIKQIATACANRIFDRMELCRGSAMLKSDIEREVEMALEEHLKLLFPLYEVKPVTHECMITSKQAEGSYFDPPLTVQDADGNLHSFADVEAVIEYLKLPKVNNA